MGFKPFTPEHRPRTRARAAPALLAHRRLVAQQVARPAFATPESVVAWLGAMQAQDATAAAWGVGVRLPDSVTTAALVEAAIADGAILRTHLFRGTWHFVSATDILWMLALVGPGVIARNARRYRDLGLDDATFARSSRVLAQALAGGQHHTRNDLATLLADAGISTAGQRLPYLLQRAELEGLLCSGVPRGKLSTYALLMLRAPRAIAPLGRAQAIAELALRYFQSRGPATCPFRGPRPGCRRIPARSR